jgi:hypothetical protein
MRSFFSFAGKRKHNQWQEALEKAEETVLISSKGSYPKNDAIYDGRKSFKARFDSVSYKLGELDHYVGTLYFESSLHQPKEDEKEAPISLTSSCKFEPQYYYSISGHGHDRDGYFQIHKGKLCPWTGKCYWILEPQNPHAIFQPRVLITGTLHTNRKTGRTFFRGMWRASNGTKGSFVDFHMSIVAPRPE